MSTPISPAFVWIIDMQFQFLSVLSLIHACVVKHFKAVPTQACNFNTRWPKINRSKRQVRSQSVSTNTLSFIEPQPDGQILLHGCRCYYFFARVSLQRTIELFSISPTILVLTSSARTTSTYFVELCSSIVCPQVYLTSVTFKSLDYLATLEIPNVNFGVFASANNIFASYRAETRRNAIGTICMSNVCLDAAWGVVIP